MLRLPGGYDTPIGAGGVPISGGQRQRIGLARAVFRNPALLVLDEPNAHLDADGEQVLVEALDRLREQRTTVILIAQRAGIMARVDKMLVVRDGVVSLFGAREAVMKELQAGWPAPVRAVAARGGRPKLQKPR